ncbi:Elongator complex protein 1, partial [Armadillidium vulgare]
LFYSFNILFLKMRNLKLVSNSICNVTTQDGHLCIDPVTGRKYVVNAEGLFEVKGPEGSGSPLKKWVEFDVEVENIISAEFIPMLNSICVTTLGGDVICANLDDSTVEVVGCVTDGIIASSWSPDQELLALVTSEFNVVLMTVDFEHVSELSLNLDNFGEKEFINVGWGRKETQFHGSEGKQAAKRTSKPVSTVFEWDDRKAKISWRGDAQLFAVSYVNSSDIRKT